MADNATSDEKTFTLQISNAGMQVLRRLVRSPGWAKGEKQIKKGNKLGKLLPTLVGPANDQTWGEAPADPVELPVKYRATGRECLIAFADAGQLGTEDFICDLLDAFECAT